jgi:NADPH-dependent glutamate synthase beta subunit-like oxidoreductase
MDEKITRCSTTEPAIRQFLPPCQIRCPIIEDIQRTNVLISLLPEDPDAARGAIIAIGDYLYERNPFFTVCGYVCGLCELACNYATHGGAIRRRLLKRFLADSYTPWLPRKAPFTAPRGKERVAVIGGGPAGLMAAFDLSRRGFTVTVFEASDRLGGALRLIPHYRLPPEVLDSTLDNLVRIAGITVNLNREVGIPPLTFDALKQEGFRAVFVARGTPSPRVLTFGGTELEGQRLSGVMFGNSFLYEMSHANLAENYFQGRRVIVIGGGNVAFDAARTARRLGAGTTLVCLESEARGTRDSIPADVDEVRGAWEEGIQFVYRRGVRRILREGGEFRGIAAPLCTRVYDENGFNPRFDLDNEIEIRGDVLIIAVGQGPQRSFLQQEGLLDEKGRLDIDPLTLQSRRQPSIFVGGDLLHIGYLAEAMRDGIEAAESIGRYLEGHNLHEGRKRELIPLEPPLRRQYRHEPQRVWVPPEKRLHFQLFEKGFTLAEAIAEARRCLTCGPCISCKACVEAGIREDIPTVDLHEETCSGCGVCVSVCRYGAARLKIQGERQTSTTDRISCKGCGACVAACPAGARSMSCCDNADRFHRLVARLHGRNEDERS